jgi:hypothetical protein
MKRTALLACVFVASAALADGRELPIVSEDAYPALWQRAPGVPQVIAAYPAEANPGLGVCVSLGFVIGQDGSTSDPIQLKSWMDPAEGAGVSEPVRMEPFLRASAAALSLWRFVPAKGRPRKIFTAATFVFGAPPGPGQDALRGHCRIENLRALIASAARHPPDSDKNRRDYERGLERGLACTSFSSACVLDGSSR